VASRRTLVAYLLAIVLPVLVGLVAVPWRDDHSTTIAIVLVLPVVAVAVLGATGPAVVAALSAGLTYDVLFTEPYQRLTIDDPDDVVATIALVVVGLAVGLLSSRLARLSARAATRRVEVQELIEFMGATAAAPTAAALADEACARITTVLGLVDCRWDPEARGATSAPVILPDGNLMGFMADLDPDRAKLPRRLELPAVAGTAEFGRFLLTGDRGRIVSYEERLTAAAIATLFASALAGGRLGAVRGAAPGGRGSGPVGRAPVPPDLTAGSGAGPPHDG
jgi:K+-sensing histidine kinase KdpD